MNNKFPIGTRVRVYGAMIQPDYTEVTDGTVIEIINNFASGRKFLHIEFDSGQRLCAHIQQCRRLKPKRKPRVVWVFFGEDGNASVTSFTCVADNPKWVKFVEARDKK